MPKVKRVEATTENKRGGNLGHEPKILVVGDSGFFGTHMVLFLLQTTKHKIFGISRGKQPVTRDSRYHHLAVDIQDKKAVEAVMKAWGPFDYIYYFAANPNVKDNDQGVLYSNTLMLDNILRYTHFGTKFVFCSSATVYGDNFKSVAPCHADQNADEEPISYYGCTKLMGEELTKFYARKIGFDYLIIRPVANCGLYSTHGLVHDVFAKLNSNSSELVLFGEEPGTIKPYAYAPESISIFHFAATKYKNDTVDVSPADNISVKEVATIMMHETKIQKPIRWLGKDSLWQGDDTLVSVSSKFKMMSSKQSVATAARDMIRLKGGTV